MPVSALFEAPDIAALARMVESRERASSPLVCLHAAGRGAPWFCIHAVSGDVLCYRYLSRHLGTKRPVYALQAPTGDAHPGTIEGLATLYIGVIRAVQPRGPYHLGGWSMGGVIAYEMARQLQDAGDKVASLTLIDSFTPEAVKAIERNHGWRPSDVDVEAATYQANVRAMDRYVPGPYRGSVALFAAAIDPHAENCGGWAKLVGDGLRIVAVPGDHDSILRQPHVRDLSEAVAAYIDEQTR